MKQDHPPQISKAVRLVRWLYGAAMVMGLPLWLFTVLNLFVWVWMTVSPIPDIGPVELPSWSELQIAVVKASGMAFFVGYLGASFWAYRIIHHPWIVFAAMLLPVLGLCYAIACLQVTATTADEKVWLTYLGTLAFILSAGVVVATAVGRRHQRARQITRP